MFRVRNRMRQPLIAGAILLALVAIGAPIGAQPAPTDAADAAEVQVTTYKPLTELGRQTEDAEAPLFQIKDRIYTRGYWEDLIAFRPPRSVRDKGNLRTKLTSFSDDELKDLIREWVYEQGSGLAGIEKHLAMSDSAKEEFASQRDALRVYCWLEANGFLFPGDASDEAVAKLYEENKERFRIPEEIVFRQLFLSTYKPYTVAEGDTLEGIAKKESGDASLAAQILDAKTKQPRLETLETRDGGEVPPQALLPGERLLVPMTAAEAKPVEEQANEIYQKLQDGMDFYGAEMEFSQSETPGRRFVIKPEERQKPLLPEIADRFFALEDGAYTKPFRTKHGWQILQRESYTAPGYRPLEEVRTALENQIYITERSQRIQERLKAQWTEHRKDILDINEEVLMDAANPDRADQKIFTYKDANYTAAQFQRDFGQQVTPETSLEERLSILYSHPFVVEAAFKYDADQMKIEDLQIFRDRLSSIEREFIGYKYAELRAEEPRKWVPTEEQIAHEFETNGSAYVAPPQAMIYQIMVEPEFPEGATDTDKALAVNERMTFLTNELGTVKSLEEFQALARRVSEDVTAADGGAVGKIDRFYLNGLGQQIITEGTPQSVYGPVPKDQKVYAFWVDKKVLRERATLEQARSAIVPKLKQDYEIGERERERLAMLSIANLTFFFGE